MLKEFFYGRAGGVKRKVLSTQAVWSVPLALDRGTDQTSLYVMWNDRLGRPWSVPASVDSKMRLLYVRKQPMVGQKANSLFGRGVPVGYSTLEHDLRTWRMRPCRGCDDLPFAASETM